MSMTGCDTCTKNECTDPLMTLSTVCLSMYMDGCADWDAMCKANEGKLGSVCGTGSDGPVPSMIMYFHTGINEYILFKSWVPTNQGQYIGTLLFIVALAQVVVLLKVAKKRYLQAVKTRQNLESSA